MFATKDSDFQQSYNFLPIFYPSYFSHGLQLKCTDQRIGRWTFFFFSPLYVADDAFWAFSLGEGTYSYCERKKTLLDA